LIFVTDRKSGSYYNISDLNRVESNVKTLSDLLNTAGYINTVDTKSNWNVTEFFNVNDDVRYIGNINELIDVFYTTAEYMPDTLFKMDYKDANAIEENLESINTLLENMIAMYKQYGTFSFGENFLF